VFSRIKWLEGLRRLRLTDEHLRTMAMLTVNFGITEQIALSSAFVARHFL
jgi:hypothetical protein